MKPLQATADVLHEKVLRGIAAQGNISRYPANAVLITEGDTSDSLFIILTGRVKVFAANEAGREIVLGTHGAGEYLGEFAIDGGTRSASVVTLEPTTCAVVRGASVGEFIAAHPEFALHLIHRLIRRMRVLTQHVKSLALDDVYGRVVGLLTELAREQPDGRLMVPGRMTQQDIADRVGSSREMVSRIFKELTRGEYISIEAGHITLLKKLPSGW